MPLPIGPVEHLGFIAAGLLLYLVITRIRQQRRQPTAAVAWVLFITFVPYVAVPVFLAFGTRKALRPALVSRPEPYPRLDDGRHNAPAWALALLEGLSVPPPRACRAVHFQQDGLEAWQALVDACRSARRTLDICTYLIGNDDVGAEIGAEMEYAARRGVRVRLLVDGVGSLKTHHAAFDALATRGVEVRRFMPMLRSPVPGRTNLRNHRKLLVADQRRLWSGGRNLAQEYFFDDGRHPAWIDLSFTVDGPIAMAAAESFEADWRRAGGWRKRRSDARLARLSGKAWRIENEPGGDERSEPDGVTRLVQWVPAGPDCADDNIHALLMNGLYRAEHRCWIATPYFVPDDALVDAMCLASRRGVDVRLLIPRRSNHWLADAARERSLRRVAFAGVRVGLLPAMMHAKAVIVDARLALCGSANIDGRSLFLNYEAMTAFYDDEDIAWLAAWFEQTGTDAGHYSPAKPPFLRDIAEGIVLTVGYQL